MHKDYQKLKVEILYLVDEDVVRTSAQFVEGADGGDDNAKAWGELFQ